MILVSSENHGCGAEVLKLRCMSESQERLKMPISRPSSLPIKPGNEMQTQVFLKIPQVFPNLKTKL